MQVLQYADPTGLRIVARVPSEGSAAIRSGSQLIVEEDQQAVLFKDGRALDVFPPGRHCLTWADLPLVSMLVGPAIETESLIRAVVVFVSTKTFDLKWGTREPVGYRDSELDLVGLRAYGEFTIRVADSGTFVGEIVGLRGLLATDSIEAYLRDTIVSRLADLLDEELESILDLPRIAGELAAKLGVRVAADCSGCGIELHDLDVGAIKPPAAVTERMVGRSGGSLDGSSWQTYRQYMAVRPMAGAAPKPVVCSECGEALMDGAAFCAFCGTQLSA